MILTRWILTTVVTSHLHLQPRVYTHPCQHCSDYKIKSVLFLDFRGFTAVPGFCLSVLFLQHTLVPVFIQHCVNRNLFCYNMTISHEPLSKYESRSNHTKSEQLRSLSLSHWSQNTLKTGLQIKSRLEHNAVHKTSSIKKCFCQFGVEQVNWSSQCYDHKSIQT